MTFTSVLFDLDGTLLDTADDLGGALNHVLSKYNKPTVSQSRYTPQASHGAKALLQLGFAEDFENHDFEQLKAQFLNYYLENIATYTKYYREVVKTLTFLNDRQIPWGIVTNKPAFLTTPLLEYFPLLKNCAVVVSGDTVGVAKPDPKPMHFALAQMNAQPQSCLYIGDAQRDIEAGKNASTKTAAALYGYIDADENPEQWQADYNIQCISEITVLFK